MKRFETFQKRYDRAIAEIQGFLNDTRDPMSPLAHWMMETDVNPYGFLPENWAGHSESVEGFSSLLRLISHALHDDGDMTFVSVNGKPRIVFENRWDIATNHKLALSSIERNTEERIGWDRYTVEILDIKPEEFGPLVDAHEQKELRRYFMNDAEMFGLNDAVERHGNRKLWNPDWIEEFKQEFGA